jgi:uncharacterized protein (TIGR02266 family)
LADPNTRQGKRTPVTLKIKFKSETLEQFIERYAVDVSQGGIFIRTKEPLAVGTQMKFEFQLRDASPLIAGEGTVVWTRENDPSRPAIAPGMGVRFDRLADGSQTVLERILAEKAKQAPARGNESPTKPPLFTDTPTRVAPAPVQEALGIGSGGMPRRSKTDSEQTPLPPPRPFHSDADDFDEKAFEEATKVRSLDELAAQTAGLIGGSSGSDDVSEDAATNTAIQMPPDELAARRRADSTVSEPPAPSPSAAAEAAAAAAAAANIERESAPGLPEPPPRPARDEAPKTKLGVEPAKAQTKDAAPRAVSTELSHPNAPPKSSAAPVIITILVLVAGAAAAVWWFVLRENVAEKVATQEPVLGSASGVGSAVETAQTGSDSVGSAGSAEQQFGAGSAGSAAVEAPKAPIVDTVIASSVAKGSTVEIVGTDQKGAAPFTAKLEKDKAYKARVTAPGFTALEVDIKGGQDKTTAKLVAKPRVIAVTSEPPGADIYIDSVATQKTTPAEVTLTPAQAAKSRVRVSLRRSGFRPIDQVVAADAFKDEEAQMNASVNAKLVVQKAATGGGTTGGGTTGGGTTGGGTTGGGTTGGGTTGDGTTGGGAGSATAPTGGTNGGGTTTTPPPAGGTTTTPPAGGGTTTTPPAGGGSTTPPPSGGTTTPPAGAGSAAKPPAAGSAAGASTSGSTGGTASPTATTELK